MSTQIDPTYLRYIYDGLSKGNISSENEAVLPEGLVGLYEEAFNESIPAHKRQKTLEYFALWALLKKEVSSSFFAEILNTNEEEVTDFIATYAAWFNSPESGKYQLYHERLKVYLLQKLSEKEIKELHEKLIARLEQAIEEQQADEFEWYALEFLGLHLYVSDLQEEELVRLTNLCENEKFTERQIDLSVNYEWSKINLKYLAISGSNKNGEHITKSALGLMKIHLKELTDVDSIFYLLEKDRFDLAFLRIDSLLEGKTKDDKFVFCLQLMEELLDKPWIRNQHVEKIIEYLVKEIDTLYGKILRMSALLVNHLKILERIWERGIDIKPLLKLVHFFDHDKIDFEKIYLSSSMQNEVYRGIKVEFAISFFKDSSKVKYLAFHSKNFEELEKKLNLYRDNFDKLELNVIISYLADLKSLKFIEDKRLIDIELFGVERLLMYYVIEKGQIDFFINYVDESNGIFLARKTKKGYSKQIFSVIPYLFLCEFYQKSYDYEKVILYLKKSFSLLEWEINTLEEGNDYKAEEIVEVLNLAIEFKCHEMANLIVAKTVKGFEYWKIWQDNIFLHIWPLLMHKLIFNDAIGNWLSYHILEEENSDLINAIVPLGFIEELKIKHTKFTSISSKLISIESIMPNEKEKLKHLFSKDISNNKMFRFFPFFMFATENNNLNIILVMIPRLKSVDIKVVSLYLTFFKIKNKKKLTALNSKVIKDIEVEIKEKIILNEGSIQEIYHLLNRLELELTLNDNESALATIAEIKKTDRSRINYIDLVSPLTFTFELIIQFMENEQVKWQLLRVYSELARTKKQKNAGLRVYFRSTLIFLNYLILLCCILFRYKSKQDLTRFYTLRAFRNPSQSHLNDFNKIYELENKENHDLNYWLDSYASKLRTHLAKSMHSFDDETIILLRAFYGLNALKEDNSLKKEDYNFLELEWVHQLRKLIPN